MYLQVAADGEMPAAVLLHSAGWPDAADLSLTMSQHRARSFWELKLWSDQDWVFDPTGVYLPMRTEATAWTEAQADFPAEAPPVGARRAMFRWCRSQMVALSREDALLSLDPIVFRQMREHVGKAEAAGTDEARLRAYESLKQMIAWLNA